IAMSCLLAFMPEYRLTMIAPLLETVAVMALDHGATNLQRRRQETVFHRPQVADDHQSLELLVLVEPLVDLLDPLAQVFLHPVASLGLAGVRQAAERHWLRQTVAVNAREFDLIVFGQAILHGRRGHILALAGLEDFPDAPGQPQVAL